MSGPVAPEHEPEHARPAAGNPRPAPAVHPVTGPADEAARIAADEVVRRLGGGRRAHRPVIRRMLKRVTPDPLPPGGAAAAAVAAQEEPALPALAPDPVLRRDAANRRRFLNGFTVYISRNGGQPVETTLREDRVYQFVQVKPSDIELPEGSEFHGSELQMGVLPDGGAVHFIPDIAIGGDMPGLAHEKTEQPVFERDGSGKPVLPQASDIRQGDLADCYLEAALSGLAESAPQAIVDMVQDHGDSVTVRLYDTEEGQDGSFTATPRPVRVEKSLLRRGGEGKNFGDRGKLWVGIIEKAFAAGRFGSTGENARRMRATPGQPAYDDLDYGTSLHAMQTLTGRKGRTRRIPLPEPDADPAGLTWSDGEIAGFEKLREASTGAYDSLRSARMFEGDPKKVEAWMAWLKGGGQAAITTMIAEKGQGYDGLTPREKTIYLDMFDTVFKTAATPLPSDLAADVLAYLTRLYPGRRGSASYTDRQLAFFAELQEQLARGIPTVLATKEQIGSSSGPGRSTGEHKVRGLVSRHGYTLLGVHDDPATGLKYVKVRNPQGEYGRDYESSDAKGGKRLKTKTVEGGDGVSLIELNDVTKRFALVDSAS